MHPRRLGMAGTQNLLALCGTCKACEQQGATASCLAPTLQGVSPSSGMENVAHTAKPRKATAICYGSACPHHSARAGSGEGLTGTPVSTAMGSGTRTRTLPGRATARCWERSPSRW